MRKTILMMLVVMVPIVTMAQKRSKKGSKDKESTIVSYEFMIIKGAEIDMSEEGIDKREKDAITQDISLETKMKKLIKPPTRLLVSFDVGNMKGGEIGELMRKANTLRTMAAAVNLASSYGWEFMNANVIATPDGIVHYYYMRRNKK